MGAGNMALCWGSSASNQVTGTDSANNTYFPIYEFDSNNTEYAWIMYAPGVTSTNQIEVHDGYSSDAYFTTNCMEVTNIATANALDVYGGAFSATGNTAAAGSLTPTVTNDFGFEYCWNDQNTNTQASWAPGSSWTMVMQERATSAAAQAYVLPNTSAVNPTLTSTGNVGWVCIAALFKSSTAGTAFPTGFQIDSMKRFWLQEGLSYLALPRTEGLSCAAADNALVAEWMGGEDNIDFTTSPSNTISTAVANVCVGTECVQSYYVQGATLSPTGTVSLTGSDALANDNMEMYCIRGAPTTGFYDKSSVTSGTQTVAGNLDTGVNLSPTNSNEMVFNQLCQANNTSTSDTNGAHTFLSSIWSTATAGGGGAEQDNGISLYLAPSTGSVDFVYGQQSGSVAIEEWESNADAFTTISAASKKCTLTLLGVGPC
jgi:hypothetical protein